MFISFVIINALSGCLKVLLSIYPKAMDLSTDHKPDLPDERQRIEKAQGQVCKALWRTIPYGSYRVNGILAMSRSIGIILSDFFLGQLCTCILEISLYLAICLLAFQVIFSSSPTRNCMLQNKW